jgi:hypothetical protein
MWWTRTRCTWQPANWHTYKGFKRNKGEGQWIADQRYRKYADHPDNYDLDIEEEEPEEIIEGCMWCCGGYDVR